MSLDLDGDKLQSQIELNSAVQFQFGPVSCYSCRVMVRAVYIAQGFLYLSTGLYQPRERVKFGQCYSSEKVARSL